MIHALLGGANEWGFPVRETALLTYRSVFVENLRFFPKAVFAPLLLSLLIGYALVVVDLFPDPAVLAGLSEAAPGEAASDLALFLLGAALLYIPHAILGVAWMRLALLGPRRASPPLLPRLGWAHCRYLGYLLLAGLGGFAVLAAGSLLILALGLGLSLLGDIPPIAMLGTLIGIIAMAVVVVLAVGTFLRLALALPVTLVAPHETLGEAWRLSSGQNLRLLIALLASWAPVVVLALIGLHLASGSLESPWAQGDAGLMFDLENFGLLSAYFVGTLLALLWTAVNASFIAIAFQTILRWFPPEPAARESASSGKADSGARAQASRG